MSSPDEVINQPGASSRYGDAMLRGSLWMLAARWSIRMLGLVSTLILVRVLTPEDFGLVAMVMLAYGLLEAISYIGVDLALLRDKAASREHFDTAWTVQIIQGCLIAALLLIASPWVASYFSEPRLPGLMLWVAPRAVIDGLQNIGVVMFRKELDFAKEFRYNVLTKLASVCVVIAATFWFRNYWALIIGSLIASVATVSISYAMHPYRPRLSLDKWRDIWSFSQWLVISRVGSFFNRKCDEFVVGGYVGTASMGSYHVSNEIATMPTGEIVMPIRRAMFPTLAKLTSRPEDFGDAVVVTFSAMAISCLFIGACLMATAPEFVAVVLGQKWVDAVPVFRWLAVFGALSGLVLVLEVPIWVSGRTRMSALQTWLELALIAPLAWIAVRQFGVEGAAAARFGVAAVMVPVMMWLAARIDGLRFVRLIGAMWRPLLAAIAMAVVAELMTGRWQSELLTLAVKLVSCVFVYFGTLLVLWMVSGRQDGVERAAINHVRAYVSGRNA